MISKDLRKRIGVTAFAILMGSGCIYQAATNSQIPMSVVHAEEDAVTETTIREEITVPEEVTIPEEATVPEEVTIPETLAVAENATTNTFTNIINANTIWKYLDNNTDPAQGLPSLQAWTVKGFDDTAWKTAAGKFGAKRGQLGNCNGFTPTVLLTQYVEGSEDVDIPTYFFRTNFQVTNLAQVTSITGTLFHDDGVAVYINGTRVFAGDMPEEQQESNLYYAGANKSAPLQENLNLSAEQLKDVLVEGDNVLSVELHNGREDSSDIYFEFQNMQINYSHESGVLPEVPTTPATQKSLMLTVGNDNSSRGLSWYSDASEPGTVQYALSAGETFPEQFQIAEATVKQANDAGFYAHQATMSGLQPGATYVYRVVNGTTVGEVHTFTVDANDGAFNFAFVGDPQIGASRNVESDTTGWNQTLDMIQSKLNPEFLLSAGDQVNTASNEKEYAGYISDRFASLPSATTIGNHDSGSAAYNEHFNLPNESADKGSTTAGTDYWFVYENTLFIDINSNNRSTAEHKAFIEEAIAQNPNVKWKTVIFHHSIYSTASHYNDGDIVTRRNELPPVFEELGIDVVLMGHDHVYTRTFMMNTLTPDTAQGDASSVTNPTGILYLTANSASGSKYYGIKAPDAEYAAKMDQSKRRTVTDVNVTDSSYTVTTYFADDMSVLDTFTIYKTDKSALENLVNEIDGLNLKEESYPTETWTAFQNAYNNAKAVLANENATQDEINTAKTNLETAKVNLDESKKEPTNPGPDGSKPDSPETEKPDGSKPDGSETEKPGGTKPDGTTPNGSDTTKPNGSKPNGSDSTATKPNAPTSNTQNSGNTQTDSKDENKTSNAVKTGDTTNVMATGLVVVAAGSAILVSSRKKIKK